MDHFLPLSLNQGAERRTCIHYSQARLEDKGHYSSNVTQVKIHRSLWVPSPAGVKTALLLKLGSLSLPEACLKLHISGWRLESGLAKKSSRYGHGEGEELTQSRSRRGKFTPLGLWHVSFPLCNILLLWSVFSRRDGLWPENPPQTGDAAPAQQRFLITLPERRKPPFWYLSLGFWCVLLKLKSSCHALFKPHSSAALGIHGGEPEVTKQQQQCDCAANKGGHKEKSHL